MGRGLPGVGLSGMGKGRMSSGLDAVTESSVASRNPAASHVPGAGAKMSAKASVAHSVDKARATPSGACRVQAATSSVVSMRARERMRTVSSTGTRAVVFAVSGHSPIMTLA